MRIDRASNCFNFGSATLNCTVARQVEDRSCPGKFTLFAQIYLLIAFRKTSEKRFLSINHTCLSLGRQIVVEGLFGFFECPYWSAVVMNRKRAKNTNPFTLYEYFESTTYFAECSHKATFSNERSVNCIANCNNKLAEHCMILL